MKRQQGVSLAPWLTLLVCAGVLALAAEASAQTGGQGKVTKKTTGTAPTQAAPAATTPGTTTPGTTTPSQDAGDSESIGMTFFRVVLMFLEELLGDWLDEISALLDELFGQPMTPSTPPGMTTPSPMPGMP